MRYFSIFLLGLILLATACNQAEKGPEGLNLTFIKDGSGAELKPNDYVFFNYEMSRNDTTIRSTKVDGQESVVKVLSKKEIEERGSFEPVISALPYLQLGDSVHIQVPVDSIPQAGYKDGFLDIYLGVTKVMDSIGVNNYFNELKAEREAAAKVVQARYEEVNTNAQQALKDFYAGKLDVEDVDGVKISYVEKGSGDTPQPGDMVEAFYHGVLGKYKAKDAKAEVGTVFDSAFKEGRGEPLKFPVGMGRVIKGWDAAFLNMRSGDKAYLFIPSELAYGASGAGADIPANSELMFYVEINDIKRVN